MHTEIERYFDRLWPICRSITGNGLRESLNILREIIPLNLHEVPTGTKVFDWEIPREWNIRDAWIEGPDGKKYAAFSQNNLHVLNYSVPVNRELTFEELRPHLFSIPEMPDAVPYMTSYYRENWGFCLSHRELEQLPKQGMYKVFIDSELKDGALTFGELVVPGETDREILISTYVCHPSMAVNELSGPLVAAFLYRHLMAQKQKRRYTYRFVFAPETVGVIAFLSWCGMHLIEKLDAGFVVTCTGHDAPFHYKRSKRGDSLADKAASHVLAGSGEKFVLRDFSIGGSDERQYCSAGFNLPVGSLMRTPYKEYAEYHTSLDNKSIVSFEAMQRTVEMYASILDALEANKRYRVLQPFCELQLGKRGLYPTEGGKISLQEQTANLLHFLSYADGTMDLMDIAAKRGIPVSDLFPVVTLCLEKGIISEA